MSQFSVEEIEEVMDEFHGTGYLYRRRTIAKNVEKHGKPAVSLDDPPESLKTLMDGETFLQHSSPGFYVFYSKKTVKKAFENGLVALVADGIHKLPPQALGDNGELYTVHGICNGGVDVPLFHILTRRKNTKIYEEIFGMIKRELVTLGADVSSLRIILDFERAAHAGAKKHFPSENVEGCAFHLAQAWNRKAHSLGLRNEMKDRRVRRWWLTIKGLIFLPPHLHKKIPAYYRPTIPRSHQAYQKCNDFLKYLHDVWYRYPFKDTWYKWNKKELRTSNIAESYHKVLRVIITERQAPVRKTLMCLKGNNNRAMCVLRNLERGIVRPLRRKDAERRDRINRCMDEYNVPLNQPCPSTRMLIRYCQTMARFISDKVI
ncbi:hypothetical protein OESDEN_13674 [Oesophagostomum dentatum]|uniref:MULE transposase domain-containing protein n=1 Tax=Oesophagostomum dentatum TaxID=61180 RepID=A0A0B1SNQ8_OESDE|nr:hypothetical protein OESDEN_13674 [Oesophagostomum dentatum]